MGYTVQLCLDREADLSACAKNALALLQSRPVWDEKARTLAADTLLDKANEFAAENDAEPLGREEFMEGLEPETIDIAEDGTFQLWYNDGGYLLGGHFVRISGNVNEGLTEAVMEG